ncbi:hypothetical protein OSB04_007597 [Centaurea solstitialis]|uniref:Chromo domain-containing protein n=1 Tax=Centaurea solstitialis TaxID=347529 RepID=A0AA38U3D6_9ASTR|nr:hypothetical protein OSB04_007597 [Centaurea solstitialis]
MIDLKIETDLPVRNLEAKVCSRGETEDAATLTAKHSQMPCLRERRIGDCLCAKYQERRTLPMPIWVLKDKRSLESHLGGLASSTRGYSSREDQGGRLVRTQGPSGGGIVGRVQRKRVNQDGVLFGRVEETVPVARAFGRSIGIPTGRHVEIRFDLMLGLASVARTPVVSGFAIYGSWRRRAGVIAWVVVSRNSLRLPSGIGIPYLKICNLFEQSQEAAWFQHQLRWRRETSTRQRSESDAGCEFLARLSGLAAAQLHWWFDEPERPGIYLRLETAEILGVVGNFDCEILHHLFWEGGLSIRTTRSLGLRKCLANETAHVLLDDFQAGCGVERRVEKLQNKEVGTVKVQWQHWKGSGWTWEPAAVVREKYPELFTD